MKVWFDCTAAAHPLVLRPVIERFAEDGAEVLVTAREYGQTVGLLELLGIEHTVVGRHGGGSKVGKVAALAYRSARLSRVVWKFRPDLAVAHGSVDLALISATFLIPSAQLQDYEFAGMQRQLAFRIAHRVLVPDSIPAERMAKVGAKGRQAGPVLRASRRTTTWPTSSPTRRCSTSWVSTSSGCWSWSARRPRPPSTTPTTRSTSRSSTGSRRPKA